MRYVEFEHLKTIEDKNNPFCTLFELEGGERFYLEPAFYTQLIGFRDRFHENDYNRIINRIIEVVKRNKRVVFTAEYEYPQTEVEGYIYLEITDITDPLCIFAEDKSRGSDYGD